MIQLSILLAFVFVVPFTKCLNDSLSSLKLLCPTLYDKIWVGYFPKAEGKAGVFKKYDDSTQLAQCIESCCREAACNIILMHNSSCFGIECRSYEDCLPVLTDTSGNENNVMVLVRPVKESLDRQLTPENEDVRDDLMMDGSEIDEKIMCNQGGPCEPNEICQMSTGLCVCKAGFTESDGKCIPVNFDNITKASLGDNTQAVSVQSKVEEEAKKDEIPQNLVVSVISKNIRLPEDKAVLSAYVVPTDPGGKKYSYSWEPLKKPEESSATSEVKENKLRLTHLTEGEYTFRVTVTGPHNSTGQAIANLTVQPQNRENKPPVAVVRPVLQTVKLPNSRAVLDASASHDDSGDLKFHWELQEGPLGYQINLTDSETLLLRNLQKPGNYTFRLTVTDNDGASNSTMAGVVVLEAPDYPPVANAGPPIILYLPKNNITLNGSLSSDDKGIVSWEWTKSPSDHDKAVDMQNTHTPILKLSLLTEGLYTFVLKVSDAAGQSSSSETVVLVKAATNKPPTAEAGGNKTVALPQTWALLNGSASVDDISIIDWKWHQLSGPNKAVIESVNRSVTNVSGLTKGSYQFELTVTDSSGNTASDSTFVEVTQSVNAGPVADAGGDHTLVMPVDVLIVNGSKSRDDLRIASWQWTREPTSLAIGTVINHSDKTAILMLINVVPGRYEFRLRVTDDQGEFSEDTASIIVKPDLELMSLVELTLNVESRQLMESQRGSVLAKLGLLLRDASQLVVRNLRTEPSSGLASLVFYVAGPSGTPLPAPSVVRTLKNSLIADNSLLLPLSVASLRTLVCQNNCSGHGVCVQATRVCLCEAFWMEDLFNKYFGDGEANCDWSILYVLIGLVIGLIVLSAGIWALVCIVQRLCWTAPHQPRSNKYKLLDSTEQIKLPMNKVIVSDDSDETDSDVLFESGRHPSTKPTRSRVFRNGYKNVKPPRIKT